MSEVACPVAHTAALHSERPAIDMPGQVITYGELDRRVAATAVWLERQGCSEGRRIAIHLPTSDTYIALLLAIFRLRCVACPISTRLPGQGIATALRATACDFLITDDPHVKEFLSDVQTVFPDIPVADQGGLPTSSEPMLSLEQPATIISTSGSSGRPKAALLTWGNHYFSALGSGANIRVEAGDRWLLSLPLYHVGGLGIVFRCLLAGATIVIPAPGEPTGKSIVDRRITHVSMVTTQLVRLMHDMDARRLDGLQAILLGGSAFPGALLEEAYDRGLPIHTSYGMTEMGSQVTTTPPGADKRALRTSGKLLPYRELRISEEGEILVRGRTRFSGYVQGNQLQQPFDAEGWYHTGDLGMFNEDGNLVVRGRQDNMFISGGENIQPEEIERQLCLLPGVEQAVVVPVPDPEFGFRPVAFIRAGRTDHQMDYAEALRSVLPRFMVPLAFFSMQPETGERMKVDRRSLAREAAVTLGRR